MKTRKIVASFNLIYLNATVIIISLICLSSPELKAQQKSTNRYHFGAGIGYHVSGNAHGSIIDVYGSIYDGNNLFSIGPCIQKKSNKLNGARISYSRILVGNDDFYERSKGVENNNKLQLYFISYAQYLHNTALGKGTIKIEEQVSDNSIYDNNPVNFNDVRLSTLEAGVGVGLNVKLSKKIVLGAYVCAGSYYHTTYVSTIYTERINPMLTLGTSISFNYFR